MHGVSLEELEEDTARPYKALTLDVEYYQQLLDTSDYSDEQRQQLLEAMWTIMTAFVDLGFDLRAEETCGQSRGESAVRNLAKEVVLSSQRSPNLEKFKAIADASSDLHEREEM